MSRPHQDGRKSPSLHWERTDPSTSASAPARASGRTWLHVHLISEGCGGARSQGAATCHPSLQCRWQASVPALPGDNTPPRCLHPGTRLLYPSTAQADPDGRPPGPAGQEREEGAAGRRGSFQGGPLGEGEAGGEEAGSAGGQGHVRSRGWKGRWREACNDRHSDTNRLSPGRPAAEAEGCANAPPADSAGLPHGKVTSTWTCAGRRIWGGGGSRWEQAQCRVTGTH